MAWTVREGSNPGRLDAPAIWAPHPEEFVVFERAGEVIGTGSMVLSARGSASVDDRFTAVPGFLA